MAVDSGEFSFCLFYTHVGITLMKFRGNIYSNASTETYLVSHARIEFHRVTLPKIRLAQYWMNMTAQVQSMFCPTTLRQMIG